MPAKVTLLIAFMICFTPVLRVATETLSTYYSSPPSAMLTKVNVQLSSIGRILCSAITNGQTEIVPLLLKPFLSYLSKSDGLDNLRGVLYLSAISGHKDTVDLLLKPFLSYTRNDDRVLGLCGTLHSAATKGHTVAKSFPTLSHSPFNSRTRRQ